MADLRHADAGEGKVYVVLRVPSPIAAQFDASVTEPHVTIAYAGEGDVELWERVALMVADEMNCRWSDLGRESWRGAEVRYSSRFYGTKVRLADVGYFDGNGDGEDRVAWMGVLLDESVHDMQRRLVARLEADLERELEHATPWVPHATLGTVQAGQPWTGPVPKGEWTLTQLEVWNGPDRRIVIGGEQVHRFERIDGRWTAARRGGAKKVDGTYASFDEAVAAAKAADVTAALEGKYFDAAGATHERPKAPAVHTQSRNMTWRWRVDTAELHPPEQLSSGWWAFDATCARAGNTQVYIEDGREVVEYRPPEVIFDAASLASAWGNPWELLHSPKLLTLDTAMHKARGCILDYRAHPDGEHTRGTLIAWDRVLLDSILLPDGSPEYGVCRELSMAFRAGTIDKPGTTPDGIRYDRMTAVVVNNSIASVPKGRAKTAKPGLPRADALPSMSDVELVTHADALLQIARAGRLPAKPIYFARAPWRAQKDASQVTLSKFVEATLKAMGKSAADLATALGISEVELEAMLAAELAPADLDRIALGLTSLAEGESESEAGSSGVRPIGMATDANKGTAPAATDMASVEVDGTNYPVPKPVADLIDKLRAATASATTRADAAVKSATKAHADAAAKYEGSVTREQADALVQSEAVAVAELIDATRRLRGTAFEPTPRMDADSKPLPLRRADWEHALLLAHYGDEEGTKRSKQLDAKATPAARSERFDDFMHEIRASLAQKSSTLAGVRAAITESSRQLKDAAPVDVDATFAAAQKAAAARAAGQTPPAN